MLLALTKFSTHFLSTLSIWCTPAKQDNSRNFETKLEIAFDLDVLQGWSTRRLKAEILYFPSLKSIKTLVKYGSTIFYHWLQNKSLGVWWYAHLFWKVLYANFFQKCSELYRGNMLQPFVELQCHSFEIIYPIENLHVEAVLAVFPLFLYKRLVFWRKWATFYSIDAKKS